ncbi:hypothetical protein ACFV4G_40430 [Kitasatospora sp. NPDC059747]|uniref:hypothetical protein n=1 Tax=Kitasatospora sp. NPDC059747 TaxID=3346930 RepID=UPI00364B34AE
MAVAGVGGSVVPVAVGAERLPNLAGVADGSTFMAWKGVDGDQRIWWNQLVNGTGWTGPQPVDGAATSAGVALAGPWGGPLLMAWKGVLGDERIWWNSFDGGAWSAPQQVPGAASSVGPALTDYAGVFMAWKGVTGDQQIWWNSFYGGWTAPQAVPGASSGFGPALAVDRSGGPYGVPCMAWKGVDGDQRIWWNSYRGGSTGSNSWTGPQPVDGAATSAGVALAGQPGGGLLMAWKGVDGDQRIWWSRLYPSSTVWTPPQPVPGARSGVGPALAVYGGSTVMTWKGADGDQRIWWNRFDPGGSVWSDPQPIFGASTGFRPALATVGA